MTPKLKIKVSKYLCLLLRHHPELANIRMDASGWCDTHDVLRALKEKFAGITPTILQEIVGEDDKQRYSFSAHCETIRANQGHSVPVDLGLVDHVPPEFLFHGTAKRTLWLIQRDGLRPMDRQYVHLSNDIETAMAVGKRHGDPVVLIVRAHDLHSAGHEFYQSENAVWLTSDVPVEYFLVHESA